MKIGYLGMGSWGFCLASLLASKGYHLICWGRDKKLIDHLVTFREHPMLPGHPIPQNMRFTNDLKEALNDVDIWVESVTSAGLRPVLEKVKEFGAPKKTFIITSKGIEQNSGMIMPEVVIDVFGEDYRFLVGILSGPGFASEVVKGLPTSVVASAYDYDTTLKICELFTTTSFRVYPNSDIKGVAFAAALKNIIAIACGISDGLGLGYSSKAALITRGLHEIRKLAVAKGCKAETVTGLAGLGDICLTCSSMLSRNFHYGYLIAQGLAPKEAEERVETVVEGVYSCLSAHQLAEKMQVPMPITETVYKIIYESMSPIWAVNSLMQRTVKEESL
jgi:glycerol-3-phosphate dehydrogenase (NAD(P)+)